MNEALAFVAGIIWSYGIGYLVGRQRSRTLLADHATLTVTVPLTTANIDSVEHVCEDDELVLPKVPEPPVPEPINFDIRGYVSRNGWHFSVDAEGAVVIRAEEGSEPTVMVRFVWETWHSAVWYMAQMRRAFIAKMPTQEPVADVCDTDRERWEAPP